MQKNLTPHKRIRTLREMPDYTLGQYLRTLRGDRSLRAMAELCGLSHSLLAQIEGEEIALPRRDTMHAVAKGYGADMETLARIAYCGGTKASPLTPSLA